MPHAGEVERNVYFNKSLLVSQNVLAPVLRNGSTIPVLNALSALSEQVGEEMASLTG